MKIKWLVVLFLLVASILGACSKDTTKNGNTKVRVAEVTRSLFYAPEYVAISEGIFKKHGLDVELTTTFGGDKTMTAVLSGGTDIGLVGPETTIYVYSQGANDPVKSFAQLTQTDGTFLVARNQTGPFSWDQLKGKTFLGQRKGGMPQMVGEYVLSKHGINPHKDLNLIQNIDFANIANAYASGTGEYVQLFEPTASIMEKEGKGKIVASFGLESGKVPYTAFIAKESFLKKNAKTAQKFTDAIYEAQQWVDSHSAEEIAKSVAPFFKDTPLDISIKVIDRYKSQNSYATNPILDEDEWNNLQTIMKNAGELPKQIPHSTLVDTKFAQKSTEK
ncbi:ABC transporter substrate-binding protein [Gottfriedia luciferensis]|uniref:ABC transporter substrate-binding protein n=1 Tax=Gottfriedia luciferensis TaxID=178774 RepID=UPI000B4377AD|nr:ABC transporter substrate-binding protein [Gottfriedia luciferensis]